MKKIDVVERLQGTEYVDAVDEAAEEILQIRGILHAFIQAADNESVAGLAMVLERAREYMESDN